MPIVFENASHTYMEGGPFESAAILDVSLKIEDGEFIVIIGHTGSGKSTLVQHINALLLPSAGRVLVDGIDTAEKSSGRLIRQKAGLVFQYPEAQLFDETVIKDVAFGPKNLGLKPGEARERAAEALKTVGLEDERVWEASPFALSGGQKRRAAIAGVLAMQPSILILDEPIAGLDPRGRDEILALCSRLHGGGERTLIMITHSMDTAARMADRVLVMDKGRVRFFAPPREVFSHHAELRSMGLDIPEAKMLALALEERGYWHEKDILTLEEAAEAIARKEGASDA